MMFSMLGITPAFAQAAGASSFGGFDPMQFLPLVVIFAVFYFLILRPQQKRQKQKTEMLQSLRRGHKVVTSAGFIGTVDRIVSEREVTLELAPGVVVHALKDTIADVMTKPEPIVNEASAKVMKLEDSKALRTSSSKNVVKKASAKPAKTKTKK